jgi:hypothetical protein
MDTLSLNEMRESFNWTTSFFCIRIYGLFLGGSAFFCPWGEYSFPAGTKGQETSPDITFEN